MRREGVEMKKKTVLLAFASLFLLLAVIGSQLIAAVAAQPRTVGVSPGDWAEYVFTWMGNGTIPPPSEMMMWMKLTVLDIIGTNITYQQITRYIDATVETDTYVVDVDTGQGNATGAFIAANLNTGDLIYTSPDPDDIFYGMTINETIFRDYLGQTVEVNHWIVTDNDGFMEYYWYRATGMLAEVIWYQLTQQVDNMTWMKMEAVIIDMVEFPPPPEYTLTIYSLPTGVTFTVDGVSRTTPWSGTYSVDSSVSLVMPETYDEYMWSHWLEDGDTNRTKTIVLTGDTTWTGVFTILGDINGNGIVDIHDVVIASLAFGSRPGDPNWNPQADLNNDGLVDIFDMVIIGIHYGETY